MTAVALLHVDTHDHDLAHVRPPVVDFAAASDDVGRFAHLTLRMHMPGLGLRLDLPRNIDSLNSRTSYTSHMAMKLPVPGSAELEGPFDLDFLQRIITHV